MNYSGPATFAEILVEAIEASQINRKQIELAARVSHATVHRWVSGETEPSLRELSLLIEHLPAAVGCNILGLLLAGSRFSATEAATFAELDANGDRRIDKVDLQLHTAEATEQAGQLANATVRAAVDGIIDPAEAADLIAKSNALSRSAGRAATVAARTAR